MLFGAAALVGAAVNDDNVLHMRWPPVSARWEPHWGPGTPVAVVLAVLLVLYALGVARRLRWRWIPVAAWAASMAWIWALALVDGLHRGVTERLATGEEYVPEVARIGDVGHFLRTFTDHIPLGAPDNWSAHVAGHPPAATLTFVVLDRVGLGGGAWAAVFCVTTGASAAAAVLVAVRAVAGTALARRAAPFVVVAPAAVWLGVSADAWFAAVGAWAVALLALAATGAVRAPWLAALGAGVLSGLLLYLSYGLALLAVPGAAVLVLARTWRPLPWVVLGVLPWVVGFTAAGFWWFDGCSTLVERYYQGVGGERPYWYFVWANVVVQVLTVGLATSAGLGRLACAGRTEWRTGRRAGLIALVGTACVALLVADLSGMSKAETERIWLPFAVWLLPVCALLPDRGSRWWLAAQAALPLLVNHLLVTRW